jgi:hypothetical protein
MAVAYFLQIPRMDEQTARKFDAIVNERRGSGQPEGGLYHAEGPNGAHGWWVFDVWESEAHCTRYFDQYVRPAASQLGLEMVEPRFLHVAWESGQAQGGPSD